MLNKTVAIFSMIRGRGLKILSNKTVAISSMIRSRGLKTLLNKAIAISSMIMACGFLIYGCSLRPYKPLPENTIPRIEKPDIPEPEKPAFNARIQAASKLLMTAQDYLNNKMPDDAINVLERAVSIDPANGQSYYYLAQAWLMKGNFRQALEFNRLADIYLAGDLKWEPLVIKQKARIDNL